MSVRIEKCLNKNRAFSDVDEERVGRPTTNKLDEGRWDTMFCKRSGATSMHGLTSDIVFEKAIKS